MRYRALKKQQQSEEQQQQLSQILYNANANTVSGITTHPINKAILQQQDQQQPRQQPQQKQSQPEPHQSIHSDVTEEEVLINLNNSRHPDMQNHQRRQGQQQQSSLHAEDLNKATKPKMPLTATKAVNINIAPLEEISNIGIGYVWV